MNRTVVVFGATGHTGRFVVSELRRRGLTPILSGRDAVKLKTVGDALPGSEACVASVDDPASLDRAISGAAAVINCAGPFIDTAAPITDLRNPDTPEPVAADESGRSSQTFLVEVVVRRGSEERRAIARGRDIYAITAPIVVEAAERILDGRTKTTGVVAAGEVFDAQDFLNSLGPDLAIEMQ